MYEKIVLITRKTRLDELIERFNTKEQARFYIEHSGGDFQDYLQEHETYHRSFDSLVKKIDLGLKIQVVERSLVPNFLFAQSDIIIALGQDGLVANAAKYVGNQPIIGINPDPQRFDGILVKVQLAQAGECLAQALSEAASIRTVTMAEATLNDGQRLLAFNDFFIGVKSHISARYRIEIEGRSESQSSSGLLVSTGAGSTGWLSSVFNMVSSVNQFMGCTQPQPLHLDWESRHLFYVVREPFISKHSSANIVAGYLAPGKELIIESRMPTSGTIFSDGVESDYLTFNSGSIARIKAASQQARLVLPPARADRGNRSRQKQIAIQV